MKRGVAGPCCWCSWCDKKITEKIKTKWDDRQVHLPSSNTEYPQSMQKITLFNQVQPKQPKTSGKKVFRLPDDCFFFIL